MQADGTLFCKGADWIDYDNDDYPDLFVNNLQGDARLYHNNRDGTFTDVTKSMGIDGPTHRAFRAGPGTTTTTAGSTSSPPATTTRSTTSSRACSASHTTGYRIGSSAT